MHTNEAIIEREVLAPPQKTKSFNIVLFVTLFAVICLIGIKYDSYQSEKKQTLAIISTPKINDLYFLDFRLLSSKTRPKEKYRIAKVVDITGDIVTLVYAAFFYQHQHAAIRSIRLGQLSYDNYFEPKRYNIASDTIKNMHSRHAIYLAKRPVRNKLFGNFVIAAEPTRANNHLIYGKNENTKGEAFLKVKFSDTNFKTAFDLFQRSSGFGYTKGQVNLAEMYINGQYVLKDFEQALYWLKQASFQSYKPAILKYGIICKQVELCNVSDFYDELVEAGVNIKVRKSDNN